MQLAISRVSRLYERWFRLGLGYRGRDKLANVNTNHRLTMRFESSLKGRSREKHERGQKRWKKEAGNLLLDPCVANVFCDGREFALFEDDFTLRRWVRNRGHIFLENCRHSNACKSLKNFFHHHSPENWNFFFKTIFLLHFVELGTSALDEILGIFAFLSLLT